VVNDLTLTHDGFGDLVNQGFSLLGQPGDGFDLNGVPFRHLSAADLHISDPFNVQSLVLVQFNLQKSRGRFLRFNGPRAT
jgi:hypothetical protein